MYFMLIEVNNEFLKMAIFFDVPALKGLIHHVVHNFNNCNLSFQKLDIQTVQMRPVSACYTSGRGISEIRALLQPRPLHHQPSVVQEPLPAALC